MNSLIFEEYDEEVNSDDQIFLTKVKKISSLNDIKTVQKFLIIYTKLNNINMLNLDKDDIEVIAEIIKIVNNNKQLILKKYYILGWTILILNIFLLFNYHYLYVQTI